MTRCAMAECSTLAKPRQRSLAIAGFEMPLEVTAHFCDEHTHLFDKLGTAIGWITSSIWNHILYAEDA